MKKKSGWHKKGKKCGGGAKKQKIWKWHKNNLGVAQQSQKNHLVVVPKKDKKSGGGTKKENKSRGGTKEN